MFLSLNRLVPHKRIDLILEAWELAQTRIPGRLVVAGDGPLLDDVRRQARSIARVDVLGRVDEAEKDDLLAGAWAVVSAAHHEGWGMSVLEGAALGTPTLAVDAPGIRDAVIDGVTGRLVVPRNDGEIPQALGRAMEAFVADGAQREQLGTAARRRASELSWGHSIDRWEAALLDVGQGRRHGGSRYSGATPMRQSATERDWADGSGPVNYVPVPVAPSVEFVWRVSSPVDIRQDNPGIARISSRSICLNEEQIAPLERDLSYPDFWVLDAPLQMWAVGRYPWP